MIKSYEQGLVENKNFAYGVIAHDQKIIKPDGSGWIYENGADINVMAKNETEAIEQAKLLVKREKYTVFAVSEKC